MMTITNQKYWNPPFKQQLPTPGSRDEFARMISEATHDDSPLDVIVVRKLNRFSISLEETIELRDQLRRVGTKLVSTTERGIED